MDFDTDKFYLGKLCKYGHDYEGTGQSLRHKKRTACIVCMRNDAKKSYYKSHEYNLERVRRYRRENPEKVREYSKIANRRNAERRKEYAKKHSERINEAIKRYRQRHPEKVAESKNARRAREKNCRFTKISKSTYSQKLDFFNNCCCYCEKPFNEQNKLTWDHFVPLSKGGSHAGDNLLPCCKSCNSSKGAKMPAQFLAEIKLDASKVKKLVKSLNI
jgi:5-methylcytosine-specific restriction endonuclease McrA